MSDFENSTQARSWLFSESSLLDCRKTAVVEASGKSSQARIKRVRKFASGFHRRQQTRGHVSMTQSLGAGATGSLKGIKYEKLVSNSKMLTWEEEELLIRFQAHQLRMLIGPLAVFQGLVRSSSVLATSITLFRRFYLSNSVTSFEPRRMAAASAFLASKLEEARVEIDLLHKATVFIEQKARLSPFCKQELNQISVKEIEAAELELLEGLNYELRCHHPHKTLRVLCRDFSSFIEEKYQSNVTQQMDSEGRDPLETMMSPRRVSERVDVHNDHELRDKALVVANNALLFTDAQFLFPPGHIAFAALAIACRDQDRNIGVYNSGLHTTYLKSDVREYLRARFPSKHEMDLQDFESRVCRIVSHIDCSRILKLKRLASTKVDDIGDSQTEAMRRVLNKISFLRSSKAHTQISKKLESVSAIRKRKEALSVSNTNVVCVPQKIARVTPEMV